MRIFALVLAFILMAYGVWPRKTAPPTPAEVHPETVVQRYLRTQAEWRKWNDIARDEKTEARMKADAAFTEYMAASDALKKEAQQ